MCRYRGTYTVCAVQLVRLAKTTPEYLGDEGGMTAVLDVVSNGCDAGGDDFRAQAVGAGVQELVVRALAGSGGLAAGASRYSMHHRGVWQHTAFLIDFAVLHMCDSGVPYPQSVCKSLGCLWSRA